MKAFWALVNKTGQNFITQAIATYKGLFGWLSVWSFTSVAISAPILNMVVVTSVGSYAFSGEAMKNVAVGVSIGAMNYIIFGGITQSYAYERNLATAQMLFASPANRFLNYMSRSMLHLPNGLLCFAVSLTSAWLIVGLDFGPANWLGMILAAVITALTLTMFAQMLGVFSFITSDWSTYFNPVLNTIGILNGIVLPLVVFPKSIAEIARFVPMTNGVIAIRAAYKGSEMSGIAVPLLREFSNGLLYFLVGYIGFVIFERVAKRQGTLDLDEH
ncbi:MAG: ABC transporter permease [Dehalococcoidales bacterium]|nr:ABC transporter permease [Dehalococcoidales bacterium]